MARERSLLADIGMTLRVLVRIVVIVAMVALLYFGAKKAYYVGYSVFTTGAVAAAPGEDVVVTITEGMSDLSVGRLLESKGLIKDSMVYAIQAQVYDFDPAPGTYLLNTSKTVVEMMEIMKADEQNGESEGTVIPGSSKQ